MDVFIRRHDDDVNSHVHPTVGIAVALHFTAPWSRVTRLLHSWQVAMAYRLEQGLPLLLSDGGAHVVLTFEIFAK